MRAPHRDRISDRIEIVLHRDHATDHLLEVTLSLDQIVSAVVVEEEVREIDILTTPIMRNTEAIIIMLIMMRQQQQQQSTVDTIMITENRKEDDMTMLFHRHIHSIHTTIITDTPVHMMSTVIHILHHVMQRTTMGRALLAATMADLTMEMSMVATILEEDPTSTMTVITTTIAGNILLIQIHTIGVTHMNARPAMTKMLRSLDTINEMLHQAAEMGRDMNLILSVTTVTHLTRNAL